MVLHYFAKYYSTLILIIKPQEVLWLTSFIIIMHNIIFYASGGDLFHKMSQVKVPEV